MTPGVQPTTRLGSNATILLVGQVGRIALQGSYFVLLARGLGASSFGAAAAVLALVSMLLPFSGLGSVLLLMRNVSQRHDAAAVQWANTVALVVMSGSVLTGALVLVSPWVAPIGVPLAVIAAIAMGDLVLAQVVEAARSVFHAKERMIRSAYFPVLLQASRLTALLMVMAGPWDLTLESWALSYVGASIPVTTILAVVTLRHIGRSAPHLGEYTREFKTGLLFMVGMSTTTVYNDADKALLARLSTLHAAGVYSAAYRIVDVAYAPVRSLLGAALPSMWRAGSNGLLPVLEVVRRRLLRPVAWYCVGATGLMFAGASYLPLVLGEQYAESVPALRALSFLLLIKGCHYIAGDTLTCGGHQRARTATQIAVATSNVLLCLWLIPRFSWQGAVAASLASDGLLAVVLVCVLRAGVRRERKAAGHPSLDSTRSRPGTP